LLRLLFLLEGDAVEALCRGGANVNALSLHSSTPLHLACEQSANDAVKQLLRQEWQLVDAETEDGSRKTPFQIAAAKENEVAMRELKRYRFRRKELYKKDMILKWLRPLFDIFDQDNNGSIDQGEFFTIQATFAAYMGYETDDTAMKRMFHKADVNHDNRITFEEFARSYEELIGGMKRPLDEIVQTLSQLADTLKQHKGVLLPQLVSIDKSIGKEALLMLEDSVVSAGIATQIRQLKSNAVLHEGKRGGYKIIVDGISLPTTLHIDLNPHWEKDLLEALKDAVD